MPPPLNLPNPDELPPPPVLPEGPITGFPFVTYEDIQPNTIYYVEYKIGDNVTDVQYIVYTYAQNGWEWKSEEDGREALRPLVLRKRTRKRIFDVADLVAHGVAVSQNAQEMNGQPVTEEEYFALVGVGPMQLIRWGLLPFGGGYSQWVVDGLLALGFGGFIESNKIKVLDQAHNQNVIADGGDPNDGFYVFHSAPAAHVAAANFPAIGGRRRRQTRRRRLGKRKSRKTRK